VILNTHRDTLLTDASFLPPPSCRYEAFMKSKMHEIEDAAHDTLSRHDREAQRTCSAFLTGAGDSR
jgi:hypothetical protein